MSHLLRLVAELMALLGIYLALELMDDVLAEGAMFVLRMFER